MIFPVLYVAIITQPVTLVHCNLYLAKHYEQQSATMQDGLSFIVVLSVTWKHLVSPDQKPCI